MFIEKVKVTWLVFEAENIVHGLRLFVQILKYLVEGS
jgi:hypothetical protein